MNSIILDDEINRLIFLCTHIHKMASNIRFVHLANISYEDIQSSYQTLLSMAENIEGSVILLESLLTIQQSNLLFIENKKSTRIRYNRNELFQLRKRVTTALSNEIGCLLKQVVERECNDAVDKERKSWRDIRTILM
jgi:hypothetical protein